MSRAAGKECSWHTMMNAGAQSELLNNLLAGANLLRGWW